MMKITSEEIYLLYIPIAVEILRYLKENIFAILYLYIILKKRDLCFKGYIYIYIHTRRFIV